MSAEVIAKAGDDITLSRGKSRKPSASYFLRRLGSVYEFVLPCDYMKLGFRRAGA